jgi:hypothetical protein
MSCAPLQILDLDAVTNYPTNPNATFDFEPTEVTIVVLTGTRKVYVSEDGQTTNFVFVPGLIPAGVIKQRWRKCWLKSEAGAAPCTVAVMAQNYV